MATITLSATGGLTRSWTLTTAETQRVLDTYKALYGQVSDGAGGLRDMTNAEVFEAFALGIFRGIRDNVLNHERTIVAQAPVDAVIPIVVA